MDEARELRLYLHPLWEEDRGLGNKALPTERKVIKVPNLQPCVSACYNFSPNGNLEQKTTIAVAPVRLQEMQGRILISWSCSRGGACKCLNCVYAYGSKAPKGEEYGLEE